MGKVDYRPTGSRLLGLELRRLRGRRSLSDIVKLSASEAFAGRIRPIAAPTLSQLENGISMPTVESLQTLATVYRTSAQRFLNILAEERLCRSTPAPADEATARREFMEALTAGRALEAMAIALQGEQLATEDGDRAAWRVNRARALESVGFRDEAVLMLLEAVDSPHLSPLRRFRARKDLVDVHRNAGNLTAANDQARIALESFPAEGSDADRLSLLQSRIRILILMHELGRSESHEPLREAQNLLRTARSSDASKTLAHSLWLELHEVMLTEYLGNRLVAAREYASVARKAREGDIRGIELFSWLNLGRLRRLQGGKAAASTALGRAEQLALDLGQPDASFDVHFELYLLHLDDAQKAEFHIRKCERYHPLTRAVSANVREFEGVIRGRS